MTRPLDRFVDNLLDAARTPPAYAVARIASVAGTPPTVTVDWNGSVVPASWPKDSSYTPVVGDVVLMARFGPQLLILRAY